MKDDVKMEMKKLKEEFNEKKKKIKGKRLNGPIISKIFDVIEKKIDERLSDKKFSIEEISEIWNESGLELRKIFKKNNNKSPKEEKSEGSQEEKKKEEEKNDEEGNENGLKNAED